MILSFALHLFAIQTLYVLEPNQQPAWKYQTESIDNQITKLRKEIGELEKKAIDAKHLPDEADEYKMKIKKIETHIDDLSKQKKLLLEAK